MPFQKRGALFAKLAVTGAALAALALPGGAAAAAPVGCDLPATTQVFSSFGDTSHYYLSSGGAFEKLTWATTGAAALVAENEPFKLNAATDTRSLGLGAGATARSPKFCVSADLPHLRFVARARGSEPLEARIDTFVSGTLVSSTVTSIPAAAHTTWTPSQFVSLNTSGMAPGEKATAQVTFTSHGDWLVDDVYIDPYAK
jgi:hypothetical protein